MMENFKKCNCLHLIAINLTHIGTGINNVRYILLSQVVLLERRFAASDLLTRKLNCLFFFLRKQDHLFLDVFVLVVLCSIIFTGQARNCDVTMSHTWIYSWCEKKAVFFNFFIYFCSFRSFRLFRWFRFGRFVSLFRVLVHAMKYL